MKRGALALALAACSGSPTAGGPAPPPVHATDATAASGAHMIDRLSELVTLLSQDTLTIDEITARVGPVSSDPGPGQPIELRPSIASVAAADVTRDADTRHILGLTLVPSPGARPTLASLRAAFGDAQRERSDRGAPRSMMFHPTPGAHARVVLFASFPADSDLADDAQAIRIYLRRDEP